MNMVYSGVCCTHELAMQSRGLFCQFFVFSHVLPSQQQPVELQCRDTHKHNKQILQQTHYTLYNSLNSLFLYRTNITTFILGPPSAVGRLQFHQLVKSEARYMVSVRILLQT
ncbi:hypothetical protein HBI56_116290 [Parastagonospora nodorum]|uniref:Uncharacterized protein n=1 Tax=Phaeosphaeria nodorum (strain SN15 / ATCC MYA-4574 / FGSC 10173) TaxID=321614 RepID=A0A7U2I5J4_PHANO|nr:hypothetical protein HBH56_238300 [Parastagonospora nodorum]QRD00682.1 hypothetical protein JI435_415610 [Parastagonospora nodorum SN15]KAH3925915.1 hypothetical protein HBH54_177090 [Parastagonospora nodorum]KAH3984435.1 hypothetical protein HBH51_028600 [Parastagonospora nodorum]KAH4000407.1 hypothetical protein HBI10_101380 [Parastagonospora nodorum]